MITRKEIIQIVPTPWELAQEFSRMDDEQQAMFFSELGRIVSNNWRAPFVFELQAITESKLLSQEGRNVMHQIGQYANRS